MVEHLKHTDQELVDENSDEPQDDTEAGAPEKPTKGESGALWVLAAVIAMAGWTLWMIRDVWLSKPVATEMSHSESVSSQTAPQSAAVRKVLPAAPLSGEAGQNSDAAQQAGGSDMELRRRQKAERLIELKLEAQRMERERLETEKELEAERVAREALERERLEAEQRLAQERAVREALEQERHQAQQKLARERKARAELERKARLEKQRLLQAKRAAKQADLDRARVEAELAEANARAAAAREAEVAKAAAQATAEPVTVQAAQEPRQDPQQGTADSSFSSNPCDGPSARFLSTCR